MKYTILLLVLFFASCGGVIEVSPPETDLELRAPCTTLDVGDNVCSVLPACKLPRAWVPNDTRTYLDLCLDILRNNPSMKIDGKVVTMTIGGATCPYANLCAPYCEYYGVSTAWNPHTLGSKLSLSPHACDAAGNVLYVFGDCIPQSQALLYGQYAADFYGMSLATTSKGRYKYFPGAVKFTVQQDGWSFLPVNIHYLIP